ncbi:DUF969 domain-containing protein [Tahibacter amnicola]|uniref:DUF969 domain-containing protein n=1 Tax=Tahibacter amnicola TaxID=2976241 RepID=A0ABY6BI66_9GAMM|nr:DUF969 domain-containing protein [Tahibacter amnicola]MCU7372917.1 DUF969 domain-containing protein [Paucibacter sp. O1-1]MDA3827913.1 DUF969 domain-containing protein [Paucibacter sp. O1-1]UXI69554.1 DUF969 domain-containing protein [Tahibacter amnicola]
MDLNYWPLLGVAVVVAGFALRLNPMIVVVSAGLTSGFAAGKSLPDLLALIGDAFVTTRSPMVIALTLPVIGLLEHAGLREHAQTWIARLQGMTLTRLLVTYLGIRQVSSMVGLQSACGHAQTVRPLIAPMAEAAAEKAHAPLSDEERDATRAMCSATDNIGMFFGEDVFIAIGAVLIIQSFFASHGLPMEPLVIALWAIPTAIAAFIIHAIRLHFFQRRLQKARAVTGNTHVQR